MITTTIEQSKELHRLGLPAESADMYWSHVQNQTKDFWKLEVIQRYWRPYKGVDSYIPAWSLSALLEVMPNNDYWDIYLFQAQDGKWQSVWNDCEISNGESKDFIADTPIAAAYELVCWLLVNNLIKKGGKDD